MIFYFAYVAKTNINFHVLSIQTFVYDILDEKNVFKGYGQLGRSCKKTK